MENEQLAREYADEQENEREPNGFVDVLLWNEDYYNKLRELINKI